MVVLRVVLNRLLAIDCYSPPFIFLFYCAKFSLSSFFLFWVKHLPTNVSFHLFLLSKKHLLTKNDKTVDFSLGFITFYYYFLLSLLSVLSLVPY